VALSLYKICFLFFQGPDSPLFKISQLNEDESKELCRKLFEKVINLKEDDNKSRRDFEEIKVMIVFLFNFIYYLFYSVSTC
jgi:hypothetical protein